MAVQNCRNTSRFRLLDRNEPHLPPELAAQHRGARRKMLGLLVGLIDDAVTAGRIRPLPARSVALAWLGMTNWIAWWYRPGADAPAEEVAELMVELALSGVRRSDERSVDAGRWPRWRCSRKTWPTSNAPSPPPRRPWTPDTR
jgi:hypothetical protein